MLSGYRIGVTPYAQEDADFGDGGLRLAASFAESRLMHAYRSFSSPKASPNSLDLLP